ncbi:MAG: hypothetical protein N2450_00940 [bacterium]|nr:hypothetical protein [bacterium]
MKHCISRQINSTLVVGLFIFILFGQTGLVIAETNDARLTQRITLDADDAYLPNVLAIMAEKSGFNIVTGPGVSKNEKLTIKLKDVPIEEAMNLVVRSVGLSYELVGNSFLVAQPEYIRSDAGLTSYVLNLQYADPQAVKQILAQMKATVEVDSGSGKVLVIASPKVMSEIRRVVEAIDVPSLQIMLATRVVEVAVENEEEMGINWGRLSPFEMKIAEGGGSSIKIDRFDEFGVFYRQQPIFDFALDWLLRHNKAEVLANSQVATMNGRSAELSVVDVFPYLYSTTQPVFNPNQTNAIATVPTVTLEREEVGVKLKITPKVNSDGYITTTVTSEVSSIFSFIGRNQDIPWVVKRQATTTIRVKDGESIVIGGLLGITRKNTKHKVPFLGDIPYFGGLFRHSSESVKKTDMIIEVTPTILKDSQTFTMTPRVQKAYDYLDRELSGENNGTENGENIENGKEAPKVDYEENEEVKPSE